MRGVYLYEMFNEKQKQEVLLLVTTTNKVATQFAGPPNPYRFVWFPAYRKDFENHMLQSRLHFRIHSALQEIKHVQKKAKAASKRDNKTQKNSKEHNNNSSSSFGEDSMEDSSDLERKDSSSSFETAPEGSEAEDEGNLGLVDEEGTLNQSALRETAV